MSHRYRLPLDQANHLRAELRTLREKYPDWTGVSIALGMTVHSLLAFLRGNSSGSPALAMRIAEVARKSIDEVLGRPIKARCPRCGADLRAPEAGA